MIRFKRTLFATAATGLLALATMAPAEAHGYGYDRHWGVGRGLVGAVVGVATLPLVVASAVIFGAGDDERDYRGPAYRDEGYPPPAAYAPPPVYYAPRPAYYPPPPVYYAPRPAYYSHESYYREPRYYPAPGAYREFNGYHSGRSGYASQSGYRESYRPNAYAYPRR